MHFFIWKYLINWNNKNTNYPQKKLHLRIVHHWNNIINLQRQKLATSDLIPCVFPAISHIK